MISRLAIVILVTLSVIISCQQVSRVSNQAHERIQMEKIIIQKSRHSHDDENSQRKVKSQLEGSIIGNTDRVQHVPQVGKIVSGNKSILKHATIQKISNKNILKSQKADEVLKNLQLRRNLQQTTALHFIPNINPGATPELNKIQTTQIKKQVNPEVNPTILKVNQKAQEKKENIDISSGQKIPKIMNENIVVKQVVQAPLTPVSPTAQTITQPGSMGNPPQPINPQTMVPINPSITTSVPSSQQTQPQPQPQPETQAQAQPQSQIQPPIQPPAPPQPPTQSSQTSTTQPSTAPQTTPQPPTQPSQTSPTQIPIPPPPPAPRPPITQPSELIHNNNNKNPQVKTCGDTTRIPLKPQAQPPKITPGRYSLVNTIHGFNMYIDSKDRMVSSLIAGTGTWQSHYINLIGHIIRPGYNILNLGSQTGLQAIIMGKLTGPQGKLYIFQPYSISNQIVTANIHMNGLQNITTIYKVGASDTKSTGYLTIQYYNTGGSQIEPTQIATIKKPNNRFQQVQEVQLDKVDDLLPKDVVINFVLIDVQKFQVRALLGMLDVINRSPDMVLMVEWQYHNNPRKTQQQTIKLLNYFIERGYKFYLYSGGDYYRCTVGRFKQYTTIKELLSFPGEFVDLWIIPGKFKVPTN